MVWKKISGLFGGANPEQSAQLEKLLQKAQVLTTRSFAKDGRGAVVLEKRKGLGVDQLVRFLLTRHSESAAKTFALQRDESPKSPLRIEDTRLTEELWALYEEALGEFGDELSISGDELLSLAFARVAKGRLKLEQSSLEKHGADLSTYFKARSRLLSDPKQSVELLEGLDPALSAHLPVTATRILARVRQVVFDELEEASAIKALKAAVADVKGAVEAKEVEGEEALKLEREALFHLIVLGETDEARERAKALSDSFAEHSTWEQSEEEIGRIDLAGLQKGSQAGRLHWLGARVWWRVMREWTRRFDAELDNEELAKAFWESAKQARQKAMDHCETAIALDSDCPWPKLQLAQLHCFNDDHIHFGAGFAKRSALELLDKAFQEQPKGWVLCQEQGRILLRHEKDGELVALDGQEAAEALDAFARGAENDHPLPALQGASLALDRAMRLSGDERTGLLEQASSLFERLLKLRPTNPDAFRGLAWCLIHREQGEEALEVLKRGLETLPDNAELRVLAARIHGDAGREEEMRALLMEALEIDDQNPEALLLLAGVSFGDSAD